MTSKTKSEHQDQLAHTEQKISDLEAELNSTKEEVHHLEEAREAESRKWGKKLRAAEKATELKVSRAKD